MIDRIYVEFYWHIKTFRKLKIFFLFLVSARFLCLFIFIAMDFRIQKNFIFRKGHGDFFFCVIDGWKFVSKSSIERNWRILWCCQFSCSLGLEIERKNLWKWHKFPFANYFFCSAIFQSDIRQTNLISVLRKICEIIP